MENSTMIVIEVFLYCINIFLAFTGGKKTKEMAIPLLVARGSLLITMPFFIYFDILIYRLFLINLSGGFILSLYILLIAFIISSFLTKNKAILKNYLWIIGLFILFNKIVFWIAFAMSILRYFGEREEKRKAKKNRL